MTCRGEVVLLAGIRHDVVELGLRRLDVLVPVVGQRRQVAPAQVQPRVQRLAIDPPRLGGARPSRSTGLRERERQRPAREARGRGHAGHLGDRREDVGEGHGRRHRLARAPAPRKLHEERHVDRLAVEQDAVLVLAVVVQALTVIREKDHERAVVEPALLQKRDHLAHDLVGSGDLAVVRKRVAALVGLRRLVRRVRLEEVQERKDAALRMGRNPIREEPLGLLAAALHAREGLVHARRLDVVLPEVEAPRNSGRVRQNDRGDRAARGVAGRLERRGDRRGAGAQGIAQVVPDAVLRREETGEERDVGRERQRDVGVGVREEHGILAQRVEVGRLHVRVAVRRKVVGPQRVDGDQHDRRAGSGEASPAARSGSEGAEQDQGEGEPARTARSNSSPPGVC